MEGTKRLKKDTDTVSCLKQPTRGVSNLPLFLVANHTKKHDKKVYGKYCCDR